MAQNVEIVAYTGGFAQREEIWQENQILHGNGKGGVSICRQTLKRHSFRSSAMWPKYDVFITRVLDSRFRFKIALLLPIKHRIIYITVKSTWNVNTSTNTAMPYHGSKGSWKSCRIYGLLVCYTYSKYISTGVQRGATEKKRNTKWNYQ